MQEQEILQQRLNQTKEELQKTQTKLAQNEKTLSLGSLSAGIAHEINNPVNFAAASIKPLERNIATLHTLLKKYKSLIPPEEKMNEEKATARLLKAIENQGKTAVLELDRRAAISKALKNARAGDLVLITGKGVEQKMALASGKYIDWDDRQVAREELSSMNQAL